MNKHLLSLGLGILTWTGTAWAQEEQNLPSRGSSGSALEQSTDAPSLPRRGSSDGTQRIPTRPVPAQTASLDRGTLQETARFILARRSFGETVSLLAHRDPATNQALMEAGFAQYLRGEISVHELIGNLPPAQRAAMLEVYFPERLPRKLYAYKRRPTERPVRDFLSYDENRWSQAKGAESLDRGAAETVGRMVQQRKWSDAAEYLSKADRRTYSAFYAGGFAEYLRGEISIHEFVARLPRGYQAALNGIYFPERVPQRTVPFTVPSPDWELLQKEYGVRRVRPESIDRAAGGAADLKPSLAASPLHLGTLQETARFLLTRRDRLGTVTMLSQRDPATFRALMEAGFSEYLRGEISIQEVTGRLPRSQQAYMNEVYFPERLPLIQRIQSSSPREQVTVNPKIWKTARGAEAIDLRTLKQTSHLIWTRKRSAAALYLNNFDRRTYSVLHAGGFLEYLRGQISVHEMIGRLPERYQTALKEVYFPERLTPYSAVKAPTPNWDLLKREYGVDRTVDWKKVGSRVAGEAGQAGRFAAATVLKEGLNYALLHQDGSRLWEAVLEIPTIESATSYAGFTAIHRLTERAAERIRTGSALTKLESGSMRGMLRSGLPLAASTAVWDAVHGRLERRTIVSSFSYVLGGMAVDPIFSALVATPQGRVARFSYEASRLGLTLFAGERLEAGLTRIGGWQSFQGSKLAPR